MRGLKLNALVHGFGFGLCVWAKPFNIRIVLAIHPEESDNGLKLRVRKSVNSSRLGAKEIVKFYLFLSSRETSKVDLVCVSVNLSICHVLPL